MLPCSTVTIPRIPSCQPPSREPSPISPLLQFIPLNISQTRRGFKVAELWGVFCTLKMNSRHFVKMCSSFDIRVFPSLNKTQTNNKKESEGEKEGPSKASGVEIWGFTCGTRDTEWLSTQWENHHARSCTVLRFSDSGRVIPRTWLQQRFMLNFCHINLGNTSVFRRRHIRL